MASPGRCSRSAIAATQTTQIGRRVILRFVFQRRGFFFWPDYDWMIVVGWNPGRAIPEASAWYVSSLELAKKAKASPCHYSLLKQKKGNRNLPSPGRGFLFGSA